MNREEVLNLISQIDMNYKNFDLNPDDIIDSWYEELSQYDCSEVNQKLREYMEDERYQYTPPKLVFLIKDLKKIYDKVNLKKVTIFCRFCKRGFQEKELKKHEDRCRSVRYIASKYKKLGKQVDKRSLYTMSQEEFDQKYEQLLKHIMEISKDENEKARISFIFNPPKADKARKFLNQGVLENDRSDTNAMV